MKKFLLLSTILCLGSQASVIEVRYDNTTNALVAPTAAQFKLANGVATYNVPTALGVTTDLAVNTFYVGAITTRTVTLPSSAANTGNYIIFAGTAAAPTLITWPVNTVRLGNASGFEASTTFTTGNVHFELTSDGTSWHLDVSGSGSGVGVTDSDKGDVTVTDTGAIWTINNGAVSLAKMADLAQSTLIGRSTASTGVPQAIIVGGDFSLAGNTLSLVTTPQPLNANLTAVSGISLPQNAFYVRTSVGSGTPDTAITIGSDFSLVGDTLALSGDIPLTNAANTWTGYNTFESIAYDSDDHGAMGAAEAFDWISSTHHTGTLDANCTFTFTNWAVAGVNARLDLVLTQDGTGGRTITLPASVITSPAPVVNPTANSVTNLTFESSDGGVTIYGWSDYGEVGQITFTVDGGGSTIATGTQKAKILIPYACRITAVTVLADTASNTTIDIWSQAYSGYPPDIGNTIVAAAKPTLAGTTFSRDTTLSGWTKTIAADEVMYFTVDTNSAATHLDIILTTMR